MSLKIKETLSVDGWLDCFTAPVDIKQNKKKKTLHAPLNDFIADFQSSIISIKL